jgi:hypothetical protein
MTTREETPRKARIMNTEVEMTGNGFGASAEGAPLRWAGVAGVVAGVSTIFAESTLWFAFGEEPTRLAAESTVWVVLLSVGLLAAFSRLLALIGIYAHTEALAGRYGRWALSIASLGILLNAGYLWAGAFLVPPLTEHAPEFLDAFDNNPADTGVTAIGFSAMLVLVTIGWVLVGSALIRSGVAPKGAGWVLIIGPAAGLVAVLTGLPPLGPVLLGIGFAWLGMWMWRRPHRLYERGRSETNAARLG